MQRSEELKEWIDRLKTREEILNNLKTMPKELRKELLDEAFKRYPNIRRDYENRDESVVPRVIWENKALESFCKTPDIFNVVEMVLDGWHEGNAPSANIIDTSSLFGVLSSSLTHERPFYRRQLLFARNNTTIQYTGEQLFQLDWDVFHALLCLCKGQFNKVHTLKPSVVLSFLDLPPKGQNYRAIELSLRRLSEAAVSIKRTYPNDKYPDIEVGVTGVAGRYDRDNLTLISSYSWKRGLFFTFSLDSRLSRLFGNHEYGLIDWKVRNRIGKNEMAKKLQCLFAGQKANQQFHKIIKIRELCCLTSNMGEFTRLLGNALEEMLRVGAIQAYWIEKPKRGEADTKRLCIWKNTLPSPSDPIPEDLRGSYYDVRNPKQKKRTKKA